MDHSTNKTLPEDIQSLQTLVRDAQHRLSQLDQQLSEKDKLIAEKTQQIARLEQFITLLEEERRLAKVKQFGTSSEQDHGQYFLFNEAELVEEQGLQEPADQTLIEVSAHTKRRGGRKPLPAHIPRERVIHDLSESEKQCDCGCQLSCIGEVVSEQLDIIPAKLKVIAHVRLKYCCKHCDTPPKTAPLPAQPIPKSMASPGLLAYVATSKYADGIPLYRQSRMLARLGIDYARHTLAYQMVHAGGSLIQPLINLFGEHALTTYDILQMDESPLQVLQEPGRAATSDSWMWTMRGGPPNQPVVLFYYDQSRAQQVPERLLHGYQGYLQTDGYAGYNSVLRNPDIKGLGCMAHLRRKFMDAKKALPKKTSAQSSRVDRALGFINKLYQIERGMKQASEQARYQARQTRALPLLAQFKVWLDRQQVNEKSLLGKAIGYARNQWDRLTVYCEDGRLSIDNNAMENKIRPFAVGRRNWLFAATPKGATASANLYSLIETAKANGLNEYAYLKHIFTELPKATCLEEIEKLLPWRIDQQSLLRYL